MTRDDIEWVLEHLLCLERGEDPDPVNVERIGNKMKRSGWAGFENPAGLAGAVCGWLERCGKDALYVYAVYTFHRPETWISKIDGIPLYRLRRRMNLAINYVVHISEPHEPMTYQEWCSRKRHPERYRDSDWRGGIFGAHLQNVETSPP